MVNIYDLADNLMVGNKLVRDEDGASMEETNDIADGDEEAPDVDETKQGLELRKILPIWYFSDTLRPLCAAQF